mgnify:CR=1 FL=1
MRKFNSLKKKQKKKSMKFLPEPPANLVENYYDLDLSPEFLSQLFEYVNELCEYINNGDQNIIRSSDAIQNLNNAVSCYRVNLPDPSQAIEGNDYQEDFKYEMDLPDYFENDKDYIPRKKTVKKKINGEKSEKSENCSICSICNKAFGKKENLTRHMKNIHGKEKKRICSVCDSKVGIS